jgi:hypothetical protein
VGVQEVRWDRGGTVRAVDYIISMERDMKIINCEENFFTPQKSVKESRVC